MSGILFGVLWALAAAPVGAAGVTPLVFHSSASYNSGGGNTDKASGAALDGQGRLFVAGTANNDLQVIQYDQRLRPLAAASLAGVNASAVATGPSGEVVVVGDDTLRMVVAKYDGSLNFLSSATFTAPGSTNDKAQGVAIDGSGNVIVAGISTVGGANVSVVRFDPSLRLLGSALFANGRGFGVALDASRNVYVTGFTTTNNFLTLKYDPTLATLLGQAPLDLGFIDQARAIAADPSGRVAVVGFSFNTGPGTADIATVLYDSNLVFVASAAFSLGAFMEGTGVAFDPSGKIVVVGSTLQGDPSKIQALRYSPELVLLSSATVQDSNSDHGKAVAVDSVGNIFVAGDTNNSSDFSTVRLMGAPQIATVQTSTQGVNGQIITVTGDNFVSPFGSSVTTTAPGMNIRGSAAFSLNLIQFNVNIATWVALGTYPLTIANPDGSSTTVKDALRVVFSAAIDHLQNQQVDLTAPGGPIQLLIPANAFAADFKLVVSSPAAALPAPTGGLIDTGLHFETTLDPAILPVLDVTVIMSYRAADAFGMDTETLNLAYFDALTNQWVLLVSQRPGAGKVSAQTKHFTVHGLVSQTKSGDGGQVLIIPNPYKPGSGGAYDDGPDGQGILFRNMPGEFQMKIYSVLGTTVYERNGSSVASKFRWDTRDSSGKLVPSGVYICVISRPGGEIVSKGKFAIIR